VLVGNALRAARDHLVDLREARHTEAE
jgi:hypothetical protein